MEIIVNTSLASRRFTIKNAEEFIEAIIEIWNLRSEDNEWEF